MNMNRLRTIQILLAVLMLLPMGCSNGAGTGKAAPDFLLEEISGAKVSLNGLKGKVVLIDFWATWCPPCLMSIPELVGLQEKYKENGLTIVGISVDDPGQVSDKDLEAFTQKTRINYRVVRADERVLKDYFANDDSMAIPTMFLVDRQGMIAEKKVGFAPGSVEKAIKKLL
jgi:cytochrome c biogenesis protein CcmG/thiol:disulfide interchange protein DsbE